MTRGPPVMGVLVVSVDKQPLVSGMSAPLEHLGWGATHPDEWRPGKTCQDCQTYITRKAEAVQGRTPMVNIHRLRHDNAGGYTQHGLQKEIIDAAKREGREIQHARN